jgi:DNA polymerase I
VLILQVHDELIIEAHESIKEQVMKLLIEEMENAVKLLVPLTVDASIAMNWYDAK